MIYDLFTFFNELDLLELRLNILDPFVDKFILTESPQTFSGKPKPLYYQENQERFKPWAKKIIHNVVSEYETDNPFRRAYVQKEDARKYLKDKDTVYFGDLDEIWQPSTEYGKLRQYNYCYFLNQRSSEDWYGTVVGRWKDMKEHGLNWHRKFDTREPEFRGWHFTNMGGPEQVLKKMESYDHVNDAEPCKPYIKERIRDGIDYLGRAADYQGKPFTFWYDESDWPKYLKDHRGDYGHLLRRDYDL